MSDPPQSVCRCHEKDRHPGEACNPPHAQITTPLQEETHLHAKSFPHWRVYIVSHLSNLGAKSWCLLCPCGIRAKCSFVASGTDASLTRSWAPTASGRTSAV